MNDVVPHEPRRQRKGSEVGDIVTMIGNAARDPSVDVNKMERLLQMRREVEAQAAEKAFNKAMNALQKRLPHITRNVKSEKGWYADLEAIDLATREMITGSGFAEVYGSAESNLPHHMRVTCRLSHSDGHSVDKFVDVPVSTKGPKGNEVMTEIHAAGSAFQYGRRYLKTMMFNIILRGDDDAKAAGKRQDGISYLTVNQIAHMRREMAERGVEEAKFCEWAGPLDMIPAVDFDMRMQMIKRKKKLEAVTDARTTDGPGGGEAPRD